MVLSKFQSFSMKYPKTKYVLPQKSGFRLIFYIIQIFVTKHIFHTYLRTNKFFFRRVLLNLFIDR